MLSPEGYEEIQWKLNNILSRITGKQRQNFKQILKKKLKVHEYASKYEPFTPLPHITYFINRTTTVATLNQLTQTVTTANRFTLDTESVNIRYTGNKPSLIQLQALLSNRFSVIMIIEVCHLPLPLEPTFELIQNIFRIIFHPKTFIFLWGDLEEIEPFIMYNLFTREHIRSAKFISLQQKFLQFWIDRHPHQSSSSECICTSCLGKQPNELWPLQAAAAHELHEYLTKRFTISSFNIGLDPNLFHMNLREQQHRTRLSDRAKNDCLAMPALIIKMELINNRSSTTTRTLFTPVTNFIIDSDEDMFIPSPTTHHLTTSTHNNIGQATQPEPLEQTSADLTSSSSSMKIKPKSILSFEEREKLHNRSCTLKQRRRKYRHELIRRNIDNRFNIRAIKPILRQHNISFLAVHVSTSLLTKKTSLYIGIKDPTKLQSYQAKVHNLFTEKHYKQIKHQRNIK